MRPLFASLCLLLMTVAPPVHAAAPPVPSNSASAIQPNPQEQQIGDAWSDPRNPIVRIFKGQRLDLWSLRRPQRPALPPVTRKDWVRTPIDAFVLAKLEEKQLASSPHAHSPDLFRPDRPAAVAAGSRRFCQ